jgi:hypothetical protein
LKWLDKREKGDIILHGRIAAMFVARRIGLFLSATLAVAMCASCSGFFTNSLASGLARDQDDLVPKVTTANIDELVEQAEGNSDFAVAVMSSIQDSMEEATPAEASVFRAAAVELAVTASGVGTAVLDDAGTILDTLENGDLSDPAVKDDLISDIADTLNGLSNLDETVSSLVAILPTSDDTAAIDAFIVNATADDLAMAAIVLLAAQAVTSADGTESYLKDFASTSVSLTPVEKLAVTFAAKAAERDDGSGPLSDLLEVLNLYTPAS